MESLFAGFVAGAAFGLVALALLANTAVHSPTLAADLARLLPRGASLPLVTAGIAAAAQALWTLFGLIIGAIYWAIRADARDGLGSPAWGFTLSVLLLVLAALVLAVAIRPGSWRGALLLAAAAAACFGWLLPHLAES